jgi:hypothetical protein
MVSTYRIQELVESDITIEVKCKIDWEKIIESNQDFAGIVCFNGAHFGILCKIYDGTPVISAEVWSEYNNENICNDAFIEIDTTTNDEWRTITLNYKKNSKISIKTTEGSVEKEIQGTVLDYSNAYLWVGCCDNHKPTPPEYQGNWYGQIKSIKITGNNKKFLDYDFKKKTRYKIYDKSGSGNHLISKHLNEDGEVIIF